MWLGGSDQEVEGEWRWESDSQLIDMEKFWANSQPDSAEGDEDCLRIWRGERATGGFGDGLCSALHHFVCKFNLN